MLFESCDVDPRNGNTLTSPEFSLQSDQELTFTMLYPANSKVLSLTVYQTSATGHPTSKLGTFDQATASSSYENSTDTNTTDSTNSTDATNGTIITYGYGTNSSSYVYAKVTHTICLPAGTYRLVFIATNVAQSKIALTDVALTGVSCTHSSQSGAIRYILRRYLSCDQKLAIKQLSLSHNTEIKAARN